MRGRLTKEVIVGTRIITGNGLGVDPEYPHDLILTDTDGNFDFGNSAGAAAWKPDAAG